MTRRLRPGLCSVTFRALPVADVIALAAAAGLEGIEWAGDAHVPPGDLTIAREVGRATRAAGLAVVSYGSYVCPPSDGDAAFAAGLDTAVALGAPNIRIWPGERGRPSTSYDPGARREVARLIRGFAHRAAHDGVAVSLEYHPGSLTDDLASAETLLGEASAPNLHAYWQPRPGLRAEDALREVTTLGRDLSHLHVFAWDEGMARHPLAAGAPLWRAVLGCLPPSRYRHDRFALLEFVHGDLPSALADDAETLRRWLAAAG